MSASSYRAYAELDTSFVEFRHCKVGSPLADFTVQFWYGILNSYFMLNSAIPLSSSDALKLKDELLTSIEVGNNFRRPTDEQWYVIFEQ